MCYKHPIEEDFLMNEMKWDFTNRTLIPETPEDFKIRFLPCVKIKEYKVVYSQEDLEKTKKHFIKKYHTVRDGINTSDEIDGEDDYYPGVGDYCVYKHTSPKGKSYIGITRQEPKNRWKSGHRYKSQRRFWNAIKYYGWKNFTHEILKEGLDLETAYYWEKYYIKLYDSMDKGYNVEPGGPGHAH